MVNSVLHGENGKILEYLGGKILEYLEYSEEM